MNDVEKIETCAFVEALHFAYPEIFEESRSCAGPSLDNAIGEYLKYQLVGEPTQAERRLTVVLLIEAGTPYLKLVKYLIYKVNEIPIARSHTVLEEVKEEGVFHLRMLDSNGEVH